MIMQYMLVNYLFFDSLLGTRRAYHRQRKSLWRRHVVLSSTVQYFCLWQGLLAWRRALHRQHQRRALDTHALQHWQRNLSQHVFKLWHARLCDVMLERRRLGVALACWARQRLTFALHQWQSLGERGRKHLHLFKRALDWHRRMILWQTIHWFMRSLLERRREALVDGVCGLLSKVAVFA